MESIAFDAPKRYTQVSVETVDGERRYEGRIAHARGALQPFLTTCERGSPVALETVGHWAWIVDEIEAAGQIPQLVHARKAKRMLGRVNKTDTLDARGLNRLQRTGPLPPGWIPPGALRDQRDLPRPRLKNRIQATLAKAGLRRAGARALVGRRGRAGFPAALPVLPPHRRDATARRVEHLDLVTGQSLACAHRLRPVCAPTPALQLLRTLPGVGWVLAVGIWLESGASARVPSAAPRAASAGPTPRGHASGGRLHAGQLRGDIHRARTGAFLEAASPLCLHRPGRPPRPGSRLAARSHQQKGHPQAVGAVTRPRAEAS